jgi:monovalent cation:H+ antiporter-2, CPA2 family
LKDCREYHAWQLNQQFLDMEHNLLKEVLILLAISVLAIALFRRLRIPHIISYLIVGIITGPNALGWIDDSDTTRLLGEIGVVFLLFTIGLDFSITQFRAMRKTLLGLGSAQVIAGTLSGGIIAWSLGISWQGALIVGGALALSSTAIVVKQLTDQLELQTEHGRLAFSILLFQDLAAVPFLALIPILAQGDSSGWTLLNTFLTGMLVLAGILVFGRWALRPIFHEVAASHSAELFTLAVLLISLAAAWITHEMGLSLALGAFLAGMMLSETEYRHQIETEIRPFRDVLLGLFFITVGMQLDLSKIPDIWPWALLLLAGVVVGKGFVIYLLLRVADYGAISSVRTGQILAQGGEFGIALLILAVISGLITSEDSQPILVAVILSMILAPVLISFNGPIASAIFRKKSTRLTEDIPGQIEQATRDTRNHVVICGFGRVGQTIAESLYEQGIGFVGLDTDPEIIKSGWHEGEPVFFGDATHYRILEAAGLQHAKALVICVDNMNVAMKILYAARQKLRDVPVLIRARDESSVEKFIDAGADEVIPETLEAGIMMVTQLLLLLGKTPEEVYEHIGIFRSRRYPLLKNLPDKKTDN